MRENAKKMIVGILILTAIETLILSFFMSWKALYTFAGGGLAVLNVLSMVESINRMLQKGTKRTGFLSRYIVNAIILGGLAYIDRWSLLPVFLGLFNLKLSVFVFWRWLSEGNSHQRR